MSLITCPECDKQISSAAEICVNCGFPLKAQKRAEPETIIAEYKYSMLDAGPLWLLIFVATSVIGIGILFLITWSISMSPRPRLILTNHGLKYIDMNRKTTFIPFEEITDITTGGSLFQKLIGAGYLIIKRKGFLKFSLFINGLSSPKKIKKNISKSIKNTSFCL